jgi:hypothetical protein
MDEPFDVIEMDKVWHPGSMKTNMDTTKSQKAALTGLCNLTGFMSLVFLVSQMTSYMMAPLAFLTLLCSELTPKIGDC